MIRFKEKGDFSKTQKYLNKVQNSINDIDLDKYGKEGVAILSHATPTKTGLTARSWSYKVIKGKGKTKIQFYNSNIQNGVPIAIILQYGHGTKNGGWVEGIDYINPALRPLFNKIANNIIEEVKRL